MQLTLIFLGANSAIKQLAYDIIAPFEAEYKQFPILGESAPNEAMKTIEAFLFISFFVIISFVI